ncbi:hypothetical protein EG68_04703 [Paragonimus skrjabini miyazakii]|uniref:Uncharacterized protein n=1 Tax=Paragonimus skrjabini miyazakii TaxID=59628 RepID=A0A8S9YXL3_9TREM|nr:hypothetical protein EG68_04703 [Paragonimus skrjabini miyazakii]
MVTSYERSEKRAPLIVLDSVDCFVRTSLQNIHPSHTVLKHTLQKYVKKPRVDKKDNLGSITVLCTGQPGTISSQALYS